MLISLQGKWEFSLENNIKDQSCFKSTHKLDKQEVFGLQGHKVASISDVPLRKQLEE